MLTHKNVLSYLGSAGHPVRKNCVCILQIQKKSEGVYMLEISKLISGDFYVGVSSVSIFSMWLSKYLGKVFCNTAEKCLFSS